MQKTSRFFYDSYAVLAYLSGHPRYQSYFEENDGFLTKLNLLEVYYRTLEVHGEEAASHVLKVFSKYAIEFGPSDIEGSMKLRLKLKKNGGDLSYADVLGYYLAIKAGAKYLTGDREFRNLEFVEFVV